MVLLGLLVLHIYGFATFGLCKFNEDVISSRPVAEEGPGGQCPQQEINLKTCPTKPKFALADFNHVLPKLQMPFLKK